MRFGIGLVGESAAWEQVLLNEGVPFGVADLRAGEVRDRYSAVVITRPLDESEKDQIRSYLGEGGGVVGSSGFLHDVAGGDETRSISAYLIADGEPFTDLRVLDIENDIRIPKEANCLRTDSNVQAVFAGRVSEGSAVVLPFDPQELLFDFRSERRNFYSPKERLPFERVSRVGKGEILNLLRRSLEYVHHSRNLPYVHKWYYPGPEPTQFAFRIDTDGAAKSDIDRLRSIARSFDIPLSWYLDVKSHEDWLSHFSSFHEDEVAVHCYDHRIFEEYGQIKKDVSTALRKMRDTGLAPVGFASPYGAWNPVLHGVILECGFEYSSEFSYIYDSFPIRPVVKGKVSPVPQVPVHPICIGSMIRVGYSEREMKAYFRSVIEWKSARGEPLFFYHHPSHRCWGVVEDLFEAAREIGAGFTRMIDFARWWKKRETAGFEAGLYEDHITVGAGLPDEILIEATNSRGGSRRDRFSAGRIDLTGEWGEIRRPPVPVDIRRIREPDPRGWLGEFYSNMMRKLR